VVGSTVTPLVGEFGEPRLDLGGGESGVFGWKRAACRVALSIGLEDVVRFRRFHLGDRVCRIS
jgi:hypothetical protein